MATPRRRRLHQVLAGLGIAAALTLVFLSYLQPALIVDLSNRLWSCF